jgi:prepilin-type processing-associated H-X9-DG protein
MRGARGEGTVVVIAVIGVLMAILLPALSRVRKQSRAVVCQSNLRQWGTLMAISVNDNGGRFMDPDWKSLSTCHGPAMTYPSWGLDVLDGRREAKDAVFCPMASKFIASEGSSSWIGGTFGAWSMYSTSRSPTSTTDDSHCRFGSYGFNCYVAWTWPEDMSADLTARSWQTIDIRGRDRVPVLLDSAIEWCASFWDSCGPEPPGIDAVPTVAVRSSGPRNANCIDRHTGGVNALFMDWSVHKVGLKELWTLKWHQISDTAGPWTRAAPCSRATGPSGCESSRTTESRSADRGFACGAVAAIISLSAILYFFLALMVASLPSLKRRTVPSPMV